MNNSALNVAVPSVLLWMTRAGDVYTRQIYYLIEKTKFGYELKACGYNRDAARYAGINETRSIVLSMVIAGALSGLGGACPVSYTHLDVYKRQAVALGKRHGPAAANDCAAAGQAKQGMEALAVRAQRRAARYVQQAVSYTPLAVYKRQLLYITRREKKVIKF